MSPAELRASLAHEMAHIHQGDVRTNTLTIVLRAEMETISNSRLGLFVLDLLYALPVVIIIVSAVLLVDKTFALPYILPLVILWPVVYIAILGQYYSAFLYDIDLSRDLYADELAAKWTQDPEALLAAMKKAQRNDMSKEIAFLENIPFVPTIRENPHKYMHSAMVERRLVHLEQATHLPVEPELEVN
jgi:Zn-dependent protease with chaperone function